MATLPARIIKCECGKLLVLDALTLSGINCPTCGATHKPAT